MADIKEILENIYAISDCDEDESEPRGGFVKIKYLSKAALALLDKPKCKTCNDTKGYPSRAFIDGKWTSQNFLHHPNCAINKIKHDKKCTCEGFKPCPDCKPADKPTNTSFIGPSAAQMAWDELSKEPAESEERKQYFQDQKKAWPTPAACARPGMGGMN